LPIDEKHPLRPKSPYAASKLGAEAVALSYYYSQGLPITIVRPFNTYGPNQGTNSVISTIINQAVAGKETIELGNVSVRRDFTYVSDLCNAIIHLSARNESIGEIVNIGLNSDVSILELFEIINDCVKKDLKLYVAEEMVRDNNSEISIVRCDNSKLIQLGFRPKVSIKEGIELTINSIL